MSTSNRWQIAFHKKVLISPNQKTHHNKKEQNTFYLKHDIQMKGIYIRQTVLIFKIFLTKVVPDANLHPPNLQKEVSPMVHPSTRHTTL